MSDKEVADAAKELYSELANENLLVAGGTPMPNLKISGFDTKFYKARGCHTHIHASLGLS